MFPVVQPKTAMRHAFFYRYKTAMRNVFINRTGRHTHTNNFIGRGHILFDIYESEIDSNI